MTANVFLLGATSLAYLIAAVFFLRYWRRSRDRLFLMFAGAFAILAANRVAFAAMTLAVEAHTYLYLVRLAAFVLVLVAIVDKNRGTPAST